MTKVQRGQSKATKEAMLYWAKNPEKTAQDVSAKFGINVTTIYRARSRKNTVSAQKAEASK